MVTTICSSCMYSDWWTDVFILARRHFWHNRYINIGAIAWVFVLPQIIIWPWLQNNGSTFAGNLLSKTHFFEGRKFSVVSLNIYTVLLTNHIQGPFCKIWMAFFSLHLMVWVQNGIELESTPRGQAVHTLEYRLLGNT